MFFGTEYFTLASHYKPTEIVDRLAKIVDSDAIRLGFVAPFSRAQFIGQITPEFIRLKVNKFINNAFQLVLTATIESVPTGSVLRCRIGLHPVSMVMLFISAITFPMLIFCLIVSAISTALAGGQYWVYLGPALFFLLLGSSFVFNGWLISHGERVQLRTFVLSELAET